MQTIRPRNLETSSHRFPRISTDLSISRIIYSAVADPMQVMADHLVIRTLVVTSTWTLSPTCNRKVLGFLRPQAA